MNPLGPVDGASHRLHRAIRKLIHSGTSDQLAPTVWRLARGLQSAECWHCGMPGIRRKYHTSKSCQSHGRSPHRAGPCDEVHCQSFQRQRHSCGGLGCLNCHNGYSLVTENSKQKMTIEFKKKKTLNTAFIYCDK